MADALLGLGLPTVEFHRTVFCIESLRIWLAGELPASGATTRRAGERTEWRRTDLNRRTAYYRFKIYFQVSAFFPATFCRWSERTRSHSRDRAKSLYRMQVYLHLGRRFSLSHLIENRPLFIGVFVCFSVSHSLGCTRPLQGAGKGSICLLQIPP